MLWQYLISHFWQIFFSYWAIAFVLEGLLRYKWFQNSMFEYANSLPFAPSQAYVEFITFLAFLVGSFFLFPQTIRIACLWIFYKFINLFKNQKNEST